MNKESVIQYYLSVIQHEDMLLQNYRMLFLVLETILFGFMVLVLQVLYQIFGGIGILGGAGLIRFEEIFRALGWIISLFGILAALIWIYVTSHRGCILDELKTRLKDILERNGKSYYTDFYDVAYGVKSSELCSPFSRHAKNRRMRNLFNLLVRANLTGPSEKRVPRFTFNILIPLAIVSLWISILVLIMVNIQNIFGWTLVFTPEIIYIILSLTLYWIAKRKNWINET